MMKYEGNRITTTLAPQTDEGDTEFSALLTNTPSKRNRRPSILRLIDSKLTVRADGRYEQRTFADLCDEGVKSEAEIDGADFHSHSSSQLVSSDIDPRRFAFAKLKQIIRQSYDLNTGHLRVKMDPPENDYPEYLELDGTNDDPQTGDDDECLEKVMELFQQNAHFRGKKSFNMGYVADFSEESDE